MSRLLHLVHQYPPHALGGTELYTQKVATRQAARGHTVSVFTPSPEGDNKTAVAAQEAQVEVVRVPIGQRSAAQIFQQTLLGNGRLEAAWGEQLTTFKPDMVHIQHLMGVPLALVNELQARSIPYVITLHDYWYGCANAQLLTNYDQQLCAGPRLHINCSRCGLVRAGFEGYQPLAPAIAPLFAWRSHRLRRVLAGAAQVIAPAQFVRDTFTQLGFDTADFQILAHGIELAPAAEVRQRLETEPSGAERGARLRAVYVGGIAPQKGLHTLVGAFNGLPEDAQLDIYGDLEAQPTYVARLRELNTHPGMRLAGRLLHAEVWEVLGRADVVVVPTEWYEGYGLIVDEAFAVGTPVLASAIGVLPERVREGSNGRLVAPGDIAAWRASLNQIYEKPEAWRQMGHNIPAPQSLEVHVGRLLDLYAAALKFEN